MIRYIAVFSGLFLYSQTFSQDPSDLVNPLMGTDSRIELSNGNTYPAIGRPWGMNLWTPMTNVMGHGWTYQYHADRIRGFKQTHQPSPWMNDYGQFAVMPVTGGIKFDQESRASWFSHKSETAKPYYYSVYLADADVTTELTATERAAVFRFTFPEADTAGIVVDPFDRGSYVRIIPAERKIIGYSSRYARGKYPNFRNYFVMYFDHDFEISRTWRGTSLSGDTLELSGDHVGAFVGFRTRKDEVVQMRVASSFISFDQAELNLRQETAGKNFDELALESENTWNSLLSRIRPEGGTDQQLRTFYSCMYRAMLFPNRLYETDSTGTIMHWSPYNGKVLPGYMFGGTGFWDTFRALYPFLNLMFPSVNLEMQKGLINSYLEGGFLPEWSSPGYADIMIGNNSASVVAEAWIKGLRGYEIDTLYAALLKGASNEGPVSAVGRKGVAFYNKLGYVPYDVGINENAARTLEYAYDDFAIYQLARKLGRPSREIRLFASRCLNYRNLFDKSTGFMRGKNQNGKFQEPFNPYKWGDAFTEGNSWHYTWSVFHDISGLISLMGGNERFTAKLDSVFSEPPIFDAGYYGGIIHEIREMQIADMGQYAHGNQPVQHMIYLYNYSGQPWKSQHWVRETMNRMYHPGPDGYCGDEDNGQTSAWYLFSAMGFYPVTPALDQYVLGAPLFPKMTLQLENGRTVTITAAGNSDKNRYISSARLNGAEWNKNWLSHTDLMNGAELFFQMSPLPDFQRGTDADAFPYSFSTHEKQ